MHYCTALSAFFGGLDLDLRFRFISFQYYYYYRQFSDLPITSVRESD